MDNRRYISAKFQLTRSAGSVTLSTDNQKEKQIFQLTRSAGSVTRLQQLYTIRGRISTHTLRGERDRQKRKHRQKQRQFQLTRSAGSVTKRLYLLRSRQLFQLTRSVGSVTPIKFVEIPSLKHFNSHAPWGA